MFAGIEEGKTEINRVETAKTISSYSFSSNWHLIWILRFRFTLVNCPISFDT